MTGSDFQVQLTYQSAAEVESRDVRRQWYTSTAECNAAARTAAEAARPNVTLGCDEFPYYSTSSSGPGASLKWILAEDNELEGSKLGGFYNSGRCAPQLKIGRVPYLVVPMSDQADPPTMSFC